MFRELSTGPDPRMDEEVVADFEHELVVCEEFEVGRRKGCLNILAGLREPALAWKVLGDSETIAIDRGVAAETEPGRADPRIIKEA